MSADGLSVGMVVISDAFLALLFRQPLVTWNVDAVADGRHDSLPIVSASVEVHEEPCVASELERTIQSKRELLGDITGSRIPRGVGLQEGSRHTEGGTVFGDGVACVLAGHDEGTDEIGHGCTRCMRHAAHERKGASLFSATFGSLARWR